jgi:hypothetical protein
VKTGQRGRSGEVEITGNSGLQRGGVSGKEMGILGGRTDILKKVTNSVLLFLFLFYIYLSLWCWSWNPEPYAC